MPLLGVDEALAFILCDVVPLRAETVALDDAHHRTLARDVPASLDQPPFAASSMDGYAVRSGDVAGAPVSLPVVGQSAAGHPFASALAPGEAVRIFTGAPVPDGADTIVIQEDAVRDGDTIRVAQAVEAGACVRSAGGDFKTGTVLLGKGLCLTSRDLMLAGANGETALPVTTRPCVGVLATGDEIVLPGSDRKDGQIFSSVPAGLAPIVRTFGGIARNLGIAGDQPEALGEALGTAVECDVLVTIGGASVGDHDLVHGALAALGVDLAFWKIAMRPGKPLMYGRRVIDGRTQHVLGLPGNPVSAMICGRIFLAPLLAALLGRDAATYSGGTFALPLATPLPQNGARRHYMRGRFVVVDGIRKVAAMESQDSSLMRLLAEADCLIVRRRGEKAAAAGEMVEVMLLDF